MGWTEPTRGPTTRARSLSRSRARELAPMAPPAPPAELRLVPAAPATAAGAKGCATTSSVKGSRRFTFHRFPRSPPSPFCGKVPTPSTAACRRCPGCSPAASSRARCSSCRRAGVARRGLQRRGAPRAAVPRSSPPNRGRRRGRVMPRRHPRMVDSMVSLPAPPPRGRAPGNQVLDFPSSPFLIFSFSHSLCSPQGLCIRPQILVELNLGD